MTERTGFAAGPVPGGPWREDLEIAAHHIAAARFAPFDFVRLAGCQIESQRVPFGVGAEVDFGREAAPRTAERLLILIPPFTPAAC